MFEEEIRMEEKSSNVIPLLMAVALVVAIAGGVGYFVVQSKRTVSEAEAMQAANALLNVQGAEQVHFHVGYVRPSMDERPFDPHYRVLEKIGVVKLGKPTYKGLEVKLTPAGQELLQASGAKEEKNKDGTEGYTALLAHRKLIRISKIEMLSPGRANLEYEWNWEPTPLGADFDLDSPYLKAMKTWECVILIQKYGAAHYKDSNVKTNAVALIWDEKNSVWKPAS